VTAGVESPADGTLPLDSRVYTFVSKPEFKVRDGEAGLFVMDRYVRMIDEACAQLGPRFAREYIASTAHVTYPRINGPYTFVDEEQAKHV
ncbi:MAG TPA: hypothetical protein VEQ60_24140, partial [Longimicrobium sp.]|nr:hypothetical protein [Longimicrobium sp.]